MTANDELKEFERRLMSALTGCEKSADEVLAALASLRRPEQALVRMRYMKNLSDRQISAILSISEEEVNSRIENTLAVISGVKEEAC